MKKSSLRVSIALIAALACTVAAQSAARDLRHVKVVSVDGDTVVVWDQFGAQQYTVPENFRFNVDGKELAAADLKAGMEGTADVANATAVKPVHITEINMGKVVSQVGRTVTVRDGNGQVHRFTQADADERGVRFYMDSKPTRISQLQPGDELSVTVVSEQPPEILTAGDVAATVEGTDAAPVATAQPAAPVAAPAARAAPRDTDAENPLAGDRGRIWMWILGVLAVAVVLWLMARQRPATKVVKPRVAK